MVTIRILNSFRWRFLSPVTPKILSTNCELITLGSKYGRKTYAKDYLSILNPTLISAGVGEDMSFDLEFQVLNGAQIILVDPTPTAIKHFEDVKKRGGAKREDTYTKNSRQKPENYSLEKVNFSKIFYVPKAVWKTLTSISFFQPLDQKRDGSFSINSIHSFYQKSNPSIEVETTTILTIVDSFKIQSVDVLKLDVEGAALETLIACFQAQIFPKQILLEVDELHFPCAKSKLRAWRLFKLLKKAGYDPIHRDNTDFLFVRLRNLND